MDVLKIAELRRLHEAYDKDKTRFPLTSNREFAEAVHEALPELLDEVERLRAENAELRSDVDAETHVPTCPVCGEPWGRHNKDCPQW
jgi:hypothetical protein